MMAYFKIVFILCFIANPLISQTITRYGYKQGLNDENIVYINQDDKGKLWLCSNDGSITSFNGWEFKNLLPQNSTDIDFKKIVCVTSIDGNILIAAKNGIILLDDDAPLSIYNGNVVSASVVSNKLFFIDEQRKLNEIVESNLRTIPLPQKVESFVTLDSIVLVLLESKELLQMTQDGSTKLLHDFSQSEKANFLNYSIHIKDGSIKASPQNIESRLRENNGTEIQQFIQDSPDRTWVLSQGELLLLEKDATTNLSKTPELKDSEVNYIFKDYEDNIWAGTTNGLFKIHRNKFRLAGSIHVRDRITTISRIWDNKLIIGSEHGKLYPIENEKLKREEIDINVSIETINGTYFDEHDKLLFLGTEFNGVLRIDSHYNIGRLTNRNPQGGSTFLQVYEDDKSGWWASSRNRIIKLPPKIVSPFRQLTSLSDQTLLAVDQNNNESVLALSNNGLYMIENGIRYDSTNKDDFANKIFTCFEIDKQGRYWIGTWGFGVILIDKSNKTQRIISKLDGLNSDVIFNLIDIDGEIYIGTPRGIDLISISDEEVVVRHLSDEITPTNQNSFYFDSRSRLLWFGSGSKCYYYQVGAGFKKPPTVGIERITFFGPRVNDTTLNILRSREIAELRYNENNVEFEFLGINLSYPEGVTYSTRLVGWNSDWTYPDIENTVRYNDLQPGEYRFEVIAFSPEGIPSSNAATVEFIINNPIWKEPGIIAIVIFLLLASVWIIIRFVDKNKVKIAIAKEVQKQEVIEQIRKDIARDFHDNIGNKLAGLKLTSNLMRIKLKDENKEVSELLGEIEKSSQELFDGTKDFIWSIDPESDSLIEVFTHLKDFGERFFEHTQFTFYSNLTTTNSYIRIPTGWSRQLVLIFKEAMTNTFKHSTGNSVKIQLNIANGQFEFSYRDNGEYDGSRNYSGRGMKNMIERANSIDCRLAYNFSQKNVEVNLSGSLPMAEV